MRKIFLLVLIFSVSAITNAQFTQWNNKEYKGTAKFKGYGSPSGNGVIVKIKYGIFASLDKYETSEGLVLDLIIPKSKEIAKESGIFVDEVSIRTLTTFEPNFSVNLRFNKDNGKLSGNIDARGYCWVYEIIAY